MLGFEVSPVVQYVIAFAIIAALLGLFAIVLRRIGGKRFAMSGQDRGRGRQPRLGIVDVYDLDRQRQLVLLRRDNVEHLVMLGGPNDLVVESNIVRVPVGRAPATNEFAERLPQAEPGNELGRPQVDPAIAASAGVAVNGLAAREQPPREQPPREQSQRELAGREPSAPQRPPAAPVAPPQPPLQPSVPYPAATPQPVHPGSPQPSSTRSSALQPQAPQQQAPQPPPAKPSPAETVASPLARPAAPAPAPGEKPRAELKPIEPVVTAAPPPPPEPKRGLFGFGRAVEPSAPMPAFPSRPRATPVAPDFTPQRTPPKFAPAADEKPAAPLVDTQDEIRIEPQAVEKPAAAGPPSEPEKVAASEAPSKPGRVLDDAIFSDMTRQLEAALKRPNAATPKSTEPSSPQQSSVRPSAVQPPPAAMSDHPSRAPQPSAAVEAPSEPKLYKPVATAAAAAATVAAVASVFRSSAVPAPSGPSSPVPPRPYGGTDEAVPAADSRSDLEARPVNGADERDDAPVRSEETAGEVAPQAASSDAEVSDEHKTPGDDAVTEAAMPSAAPAAVSENEPIVQADPVSELAPETTEEATSAEQEEIRRVSEEDVASSAQAEESVQEGADASSEQPSEQAAATDAERPREPTPVIDPFSVDEIEAEFARLLGRSVEKDPKNP